MSCEHLICAQCAGPVAEGRCPVCRASRSALHHHGPGQRAALPYAAAILLLALALLLAMQHVGR